MRGQDTQQAGMFSYLSPEERVPVTHPLRPIRQYVDTALTALSPQLATRYAHTGRPSIAPEKLLRALLLQVLYSLRSERLLMEELPYNLLFRWFVGLDLDAPVWDVTVFTKNRDRLLAGAVATAFFEQVLAQAKTHRLLSDEHFTVDGTLIEAWAGQKSFKLKRAAVPMPPPEDPGNPSVDFRGERRTNATHVSTTDPEARLYKKAAGPGGQTVLLGACVDGESTWLGGEYAPYPGDRHGGTGGGAGPASRASWPTACDAGGRQKLRYARVRAGSAGGAGHAPCGAAYDKPCQGH
jgi:transposase